MIDGILEFYRTYNWNENIKDWRRAEIRDGHFWELSKVVFSAVRVKKPETYLEIGVCEGDSLSSALLAGGIKEVTLIDNWSGEYGGTGRGNSLHIRRLLDQYLSLDKQRIFSQDSKEALPILLEQGYLFDLITVDGDHSENGARIDLEMCWKMLSPGGVLLFDDICHPNHRYLMDVVENFAVDNYKDKGCGRVAEFNCIKKHYGVAILVKSVEEITMSSDRTQLLNDITQFLNREKILDFLQARENLIIDKVKGMFASQVKKVERAVESADNQQKEAQKKIDKIPETVKAQVESHSADTVKASRNNSKRLEEAMKKIAELEKICKSQESRIASAEKNSRVLEMILSGAEIKLELPDKDTVEKKVQQ